MKRIKPARVPRKGRNTGIFYANCKDPIPLIHGFINRVNASGGNPQLVIFFLLWHSKNSEVIVCR
jgi:hypothetical protein